METRRRSACEIKSLIAGDAHCFGGCGSNEAALGFCFVPAARIPVLCYYKHVVWSNISRGRRSLARSLAQRHPVSRRSAVKLLIANFQLLARAIVQPRYRERDWALCIDFGTSAPERALRNPRERSYRHRRPVNRCHS